jgi:murein DD-endopeptidase MepM/ murein hydrolase activator NlpD
MVGRRAGLKGAFAAALPEKRIFIQSRDRARSLRLGAGLQLLLVLSAFAAAGWLALATAHLAADLVAADGEAGRAVVLHEAYRARLNVLTEERDARAAEALAAQSRFQAAVAEIGRQQSALLAAAAERRELEAALALTRDRVARAIGQRDAAVAANDRLLAEMEAARASLATRAGDADLADTLAAVTGALSAAVEARDGARAEREALAAELAAAELELRVTTRRQDAMIAELREAVAASAGAFEEVLRRADLDVDSMVASLRQDYSGQGGPLVAVGVSSRSYPGDAAATSRFDELMVDIDRVNLLRIAIGKVPYAMPVRDVHRFTSGFGYRRDPKGGGRRMHAGVDFAAPQGTPIYAAADGVVASAKSESGYGQTVRIRHDFGFETVYAHQSRLRVTPGRRVSRGDHIGDMGRTGRTTGVHLHYEVHLNGRPVNPMTYVEAAKNVF